MACIGFRIYLQYIFSLVLFFYYNISADWNWIFYDMDLTLEIKESEELIDSSIWKLELKEITEQVIVKRQELNISFSAYERNNQCLQNEIKEENGI